MSTRSLIARRQQNGNYIYVYSHSDGNSAHNGAILKHHYGTEERAKELIQQGAISSLDVRIHPTSHRRHDFCHREDGVTTFYHRDRGEPKDVSDPVMDTQCLLDAMNRFDAEYFYLFERGGWVVASDDYWYGWKSIDEAIRLDLAGYEPDRIDVAIVWIEALKEMPKERS